MAWRPKVRELGKPRLLTLAELRVGHKLRDPVLGFRGKVLMDTGEVLTQKHLDQIAKWDAREGLGKLSHHTRAVWVVNTDASGDERPACDFDPYAALSVQKYYKSHK